VCRIGWARAGIAELAAAWDFGWVDRSYKRCRHDGMAYTSDFRKMLTLQAVIGKTRDDGCSPADSHPKCAAYHRSHRVAATVTMTLI